jgi:hypothetical protein
LKAGEDLDVLLRDQVGTTAERLADLDHQALEAKGAAVDTASALAVVTTQPTVVLVLGHSTLPHLEGLVAEEDAGGHAAGVADAYDAYVTQMWNGHRRLLLLSLATL